MIRIETCRFIALGVLAAVLALGIGCGPEKTTQSNSMRDAGTSSTANLDLGEDWEGDRASTRTPARIPARAGTRGGAASQQQTAQSERGQWTIVLGTFSGDDHAQQARLVQQQVTAAVPEVRGAQVHSTERGSMLIVGSYAAADDPRAVADLARIKEANFNNMPVFARAFLTPMPRARTASAAPASRSEYDLMKAREVYPDVHPLYTLQVAVWSDFDSGAISAAEIRRQAEAHAQRLRSQGHEAYVHHDDAARQSLVTVGLFNRTALDSSTGEYSDEVRLLMRRFPHHLVNGEELQEPIDRRRPDRGTRPQRTFLVIVPRE